MTASGIYLICNTVNGKVYVGSALSLAKRFSLHKRSLERGVHHSIHLQNAWKKHGAEAFQFVCLEVIDNAAKLIEREQAWINWFKSWDRGLGYNIAPIAGSSTGIKRTEAFKAGISARETGRKLSNDQKVKLSAAATGRILSAETKAKVSATSKGRKHPPRSAEARAKMSAWQVGRKLSDEHKANISRAEIGRVFSDAHKAKLVLAWHNRRRASEMRAPR